MPSWFSRCLSLAGGDDGAGQLVDGVGRPDWGAADVEADAISDQDLVGGQQADRRRALGVEKQQQAGEPAFGVKGGVVQQPAGGRPPVIAVECIDRTLPASGGEVGGGGST
jgi:hypothetical protein